MTARVWPVDAVSGSPSYAGRGLRQNTVSPFVGQAAGTRPLGGLSGVRPSTPTNIVTATSTTWTVTPFLGLLDGEAAAIAGVYAYSFDTNQTGSVTAAAGSARIDRLDVQVSDPAESDGSSVPAVAVVYTAGTPGAGVPTSAPARSHPLALINVPASGGGSPTVTWNASYYAAPGGFVPFNTVAGLVAWTTATVGQHATVINDTTPANNGDYAFNGSVWLPDVYATQVGTTGISVGASGATWTLAVSFATNRFSVAPVVAISIQSSGGAARKLVAQVSAITSTGFTAIVSTGDGSNPGSQTASLGWIAMQMTPSTATG